MCLYYDKKEVKLLIVSLEVIVKSNGKYSHIMIKGWKSKLWKLEKMSYELFEICHFPNVPPTIY